MIWLGAYAHPQPYIPNHPRLFDILHILLAQCGGGVSSRAANPQTLDSPILSPS